MQALLLSLACGPLPVSDLEQVHGGWEARLELLVDDSFQEQDALVIFDADTERFGWSREWVSEELQDSWTFCESVRLPHSGMLVVEDCTDYVPDGDPEEDPVELTRSGDAFHDVALYEGRLFLGEDLIFSRADILLF